MRSLAVFLACGIASIAHAAITLTDDLGRSVTLKEPARRIATLAPFLTELVFAAGAGDRVVGVSAFSDYPPEAKRLPVVSSAVQVSIEPLAALAPDFVLAWRDAIRREDIERMERFGAAVFVAQGRTLADVPRLLHAIGAATGRDVSRVVESYESRLERLRRDNAAKARIPVFLEIWHRPLTTISGRHFMNDALEICRGDNVFADRAGVAPMVSWEDLYARNPVVIIGAGSAPSAREFEQNWRVRTTLDAVKGGRYFFVDGDTIQRATTRTPEGIAQLCAVLDRVRSSASPR